MVYSTIQHNSTPPPPHSHTLSVHIYCTMYIQFGREGRGATVHKYIKFLRPWGQQFTSWVEKQTMSKCISTLQSINSVNHNAAKSVNRSILKKSRHIGFVVFIIHSSMGRRMHACLSLRLSLYRVSCIQRKRK